MTAQTLNWQTAPGHQVLAAAGKKILRPGGRKATERLFEQADFQAGESVLELASSFGYSAIALAKKYDVCVTGVEKNPDSVAIARENIAKTQSSEKVRVVEGDILHLDRLDDRFNYVLAEAILTMQSDAGKAKILAGIRDRLQPGGLFLSHELLARDRHKEIRRSLADSIRVNANPLSQAEWVQACEKAGLEIVFQQTGKMGLLHLQQMLYDEGWWNTGKIAWNMLTRPQIRSRILKMRRSFQQHQDNLGHIILCARRV